MPSQRLLRDVVSSAMIARSDGTISTSTATRACNRFAGDRLNPSVTTPPRGENELKVCKLGSAGLRSPLPAVKRTEPLGLPGASLHAYPVSLVSDHALIDAEPKCPHCKVNS